MINFIITLVLIAFSVFLMIISVRYGLAGAYRLDNYFSQKNNSNYSGFQWHFRIPFLIGVIPEYFYAIVLGYENYFNKNWWALKMASFISVLVFIAGLKNRTALSEYFSFSFLNEGDITSLYTSGNLIILMNIVVVLSIALFILICIESVKMHGFYAPIRIITYSILSILLANITVVTLSLIIFISIAYIVLKIIGFFLFSSDKKKNEDDSEETAGSILMGGFREFKADLYEWEATENSIKEDKKDLDKIVLGKKPKITRRIKVSKMKDSIQRTYPD